MDKKDKDNPLDDFKKLENEIIVDQVKEIFRTRPKNYIGALEEIGFEYHEEDDYEDGPWLFFREQPDVFAAECQHAADRVELIDELPRAPHKWDQPVHPPER